MMGTIHGVLFDLDGTLIDTAHDLLVVLNLILKEQHKPTIHYDLLRQHVSGGLHAMMHCAFGIDETHETFRPLEKQCLDYYAAHIGQHAAFFEGIESLLDDLDQAHIPWGIVTNKPKRFTELLLKAMKLDQRARCVVAADTLAYMKPHPAPMLHACHLLKTEPQHTVYVGDFKTDVEASRAAQMPCVILTHGYYDNTTHPQDWGADLVLDNPRMLMTYLNQPIWSHDGN